MSLTKRHFESQRENLIENESEYLGDYDLMYKEWLESQEYEKLVASGELSPKISTSKVVTSDLPF